MRKTLLLVAALLLLVAGAARFRFPIAAFVVSLEGPPALGPQGELAANERWFDDYYTVAEIDSETFAIGEPRYAGQVYSYLIVGDEEALLFDSGMPLRDISPVVESLTERPLTVLASHLHYDHVGNHHRFERVAMPDLSVIRDRIDAEWFTPSRYQYMGFVEGWDVPRWRVSELLPPGAAIELGGRTLEVLHTPGHTDDSISLWDAGRELLFSGDYIYEGPLYAFLPNSSLRAYLASAELLLSVVTPRTRILSAHRITPPGPPILALQDLLDLRKLLIAIRDGEAERTGFFPARYRINDELTLETDAPIFQDLP